MTHPVIDFTRVLAVLALTMAGTWQSNALQAQAFPPAVTALVTTQGASRRGAIPSAVGVAGRVIYPEGVAAPRRVTVLLNARGSGHMTVMDPDGSFEFLGVGPGVYSVVVMEDGVEGILPLMSLTVADTDVAGVEVRIPGMVTLTGTVVIEGNAAQPPGLSLAFVNPVEQFPILAESIVVPIPSATRDFAGFGAQLPVGTYRLLVSELSAAYAVKSITSGSTDLLVNPVKIDANMPPIVVTLKALSPGSVSGRVTGFQGAPAASPTRIGFMLMSLSGRSNAVPLNSVGAAIAEGEIGAAGFFAVSGLVPGLYTAFVSGTGVPLPEASITIPTSGINDLEIAFPHVRKVVLRATVEGGSAVPQFTLRFAGKTTPGSVSGTPGKVPSTSVSGNEIDVSPLADGAFQFALAEGEYRFGIGLSEGARPPTHRVKSMTSGAVDLLAERLRINAKDDVEIRIVFEPTGAPAR